jgi:hypothetical protein
MAGLKLKGEEIHVSDALVVRMAERLWKLGTDERRANCAERARKRLEAGQRRKNDIAVVIVADHA